MNDVEIDPTEVAQPERNRRTRHAPRAEAPESFIPNRAARAPSAPSERSDPGAAASTAERVPNDRATEALQHVLAQAERLPFLLLVARLEQVLGREVGGAARARDEPVQFAQDPALAFHARDIVAVAPAEDENGRVYVRVVTAFAGLMGAASPLPTLLLEELARGDDELASQRVLLDYFHHRLLALFYRGMRALDLASGNGPRTSILALCGLAPATAARVGGLPEDRLLALAPLLVAYPPNAQRIAAGIMQLLGDVLGAARVAVRERRGGRVKLAHGARARLGLHVRLGRTSTLGTTAIAPSAAIEVTLGPLTATAYAQLAPGGARAAELAAVTRLLTPETIDVTISLQPADVPSACLGRDALPLGQATWLGSAARPAPLRVPLETLTADHDA